MYNREILVFIFNNIRNILKCFDVGDGDSSVTKRLHEVQPYRPNFYIKKIECCNHLMRNYTSKLTTLARNSKYPLRVRKFILTNILRFRSDVTKAAKHWRNLNDLTMSQKIKGRCII